MGINWDSYNNSFKMHLTKTPSLKTSAEDNDNISVTEDTPTDENNKANNLAGELTYENTMSYLEYFAIPKQQDKNNPDVNNDGYISDIEYNAMVYEYNNTEEEEKDNFLKVHINSILDTAEVRYTDNPSGIISRIESSIKSFRLELARGNYTQDEVEKSLKELISAMSRAKDQIWTQYERQYVSCQIAEFRETNRQHLDDFLNGITPIISKYQSILAEINSTNVETVQKHSFTIIQNTDKIREAGEHYSEDDFEYTESLFNSYLKNIEQAEQKTGFAGEIPKDYMSLEVTKQIISALKKAEETILSKLGNSLNNAKADEERAEINSKKEKFENYFKNKLEYYSEIQIDAENRTAAMGQIDISLPEEIKEQYSKLNSTSTIDEKINILSNISEIFNKLIGKKEIEYICYSEADEKEYKAKLRLELSNLKDLKDLFTIPEGITKEDLERISSNNASSTYLDELMDEYKKIVNETDKGELNNTKFNIRKIFSVIKQNKEKTIKLKEKIENFTNTRNENKSEDQLNELKNMISNSSLNNTTKTELWIETYSGLNKLYKSIKEEMSEVKDESLKKAYDNMLTKISSDIEKITKEINDLFETGNLGNQKVLNDAFDNVKKAFEELKK